MIEDYKPNRDIFNDEEEDITMLKEAVENLKPADKIIFLLYCEYGSLREVGKELGVSHTTIYKQINIIKDQIREWCKIHYPNNIIFK